MSVMQHLISIPRQPQLAVASPCGACLGLERFIFIRSHLTMLCGGEVGWGGTIRKVWFESNEMLHRHFTWDPTLRNSENSGAN